MSIVRYLKGKQIAIDIRLDFIRHLFKVTFPLQRENRHPVAKQFGRHFIVCIIFSIFSTMEMHQAEDKFCRMIARFLMTLITDAVFRILRKQNRTLFVLFGK